MKNKTSKKKKVLQKQRSTRVLYFICFLLIVISVWTVAYFLRISGIEEVAHMRSYNLSAEFSHLPVLQEGMYELWLYGDGQFNSTGQFKDGEKIKAHIFQTKTNFVPEKIVLSIESEFENSKPSQTVILEGEIKNQKATLSCKICQLSSNNPLNFILTTPTDGDKNNEYAGIWFIDNSVPQVKAGFPIPQAPLGWSFEGWVYYQQRFLTIGRFSQNNVSDSLSLYSSLAAPPPNFPGEDFLESAPDGINFPARLNDGTSELWVTLEPDTFGIDPTGDDPFTLYLYRGIIEKNAKVGQNLKLPFTLESFTPQAQIKII